MLVAHDAIDQTFFQPVETKEAARARLSLSNKDNVVMYIGGFDAWKGTETFFAAAKFSPSLRFVVIGGTNSETQFFSKKYPEVTFLGQHPYRELKDNQQAADILVVPNSGQNDLSLKYTSPLKLFAHMASGVPLVISDIPSLVTVAGRDLVTTVVPDSPQALAEGIKNVFEDYDVKKRSAQALKEQAIRYTWDKRAEAIITFISNE
jgi:glycosyltransferase involved in cell wall biosynthesis